MQQKIETLRQELDVIDTQLVCLWERRTAITDKIGALKAAEGITVRDEAREAAVLSHCRDALCDKSLADDLAALYDAIFAISCRRQEGRR